MKNISVFFILILLSCSIKNDLPKNPNNINRIEVYKFMYINTYPIPINEKSFWNDKEEHALLYIPISSIDKSFIKDIQNMKSDSYNSFDFIRYAFIVNIENKKDTLYLDSSLKNWFSIEKNKKQYYFDDKGKVARVLLHYPFFSNCW